jgi:hypothetical protein
VFRVRSFSVRARWAIVLGLAALSFAVSQRASAIAPAIPDRATARAELDALVMSSEGSIGRLRPRPAMLDGCAP